MYGHCDHELVVMAWIGLGANLGDPVQQMLWARDYLVKKMDLIGVSSLYQTAPVECSGEQNDYLNAVICLRTKLLPHELLNQVLSIEVAMGRERNEYHGPRTLDLDILMYGSLSYSDETLTLPHPGLVHRAFVLEPMCELVPDWILPNNKTVRDTLKGLSGQRVERYSCDQWQFQPFQKVNES